MILKKRETNLVAKKKPTHQSEKTSKESDSQGYWLRFVIRFFKEVITRPLIIGLGRLFSEGSDVFYCNITICFRDDAIIELLIYLIWLLISMM